MSGDHQRIHHLQNFTESCLVVAEAFSSGPRRWINRLLCELKSLTEKVTEQDKGKKLLQRFLAVIYVIISRPIWGKNKKNRNCSNQLVILHVNEPQIRCLATRADVARG